MSTDLKTEALRKCKTCALPTEVRDLVNAALAAAPAGGAEPVAPMDDDELQDFCISLSFEQDDYTTEVIRAVEDRMRGVPLFVPAAAPTLLNGLTEQETAASASVAGLSGAQPGVVLFDDRPQLQRIAEAEERMRNPAPLQWEEQPCKGANCGATDGVSHSPECHAEHAATVDAGLLDTPGNRNPDDRYDGYKGRPLRAGATADQRAAHAEGVRAAQPEAPAEPSDARALLGRWVVFGKAMWKAGGSLPRHLVHDTEAILATPAPATQQPAELTGWKLVKQSRLDEIAKYAADPSEPCYEGRGLYDDREVRNNWRRCASNLDAIACELKAIRDGHDDEDLAEAKGAIKRSAAQHVEEQEATNTSYV